MFNLIRGELYRVVHKKSLYLYFGFLTIGYILLAVVRSGGFNNESVIGDARNLFFLTPSVVGGFLFSAIYTDDLNAKNLITLVGYGLSKSKIVITKVILAAFFVTVFFGLLPLLHSATYMLLGCTVTSEQLATVYAISVGYLLITLAYTSLSSIVVYGVQNPTFAVVSYFLLAFSVIDQLLMMVTSMLKLDISYHIISGITNRIMEGIVDSSVPLQPIIEYAFYITISSALAAITFNRKEMEF